MKSLSEANEYVWGVRLVVVEVVGAGAGAGIDGSGTGGVIGPISARATQARPCWRVEPSPKNCTCRRMPLTGALSTMRSLVHCGRSVKRIALSSTPDHNAVAR